MGPEAKLMVKKNDIYNPYQSRDEYVYKAFAQDSEEGNTSIVDGLGRVFLFEQGNDYPVLPSLGHVCTSNHPLPYKDKPWDYPGEGSADKLRRDPILSWAAMQL